MSLTTYTMDRLSDFSDTESRQEFMDSLSVDVDVNGQMLIERYNKKSKRYDTYKKMSITVEEENATSKSWSVC
jgi:hypothetical protein